jgi:hypothetical protein
MLTIAGGHAKIVNVFLLAVGLFALAALVIFVGIHVFLAAVGHYAPWEQIWAG